MAKVSHVAKPSVISGGNYSRLDTGRHEKIRAYLCNLPSVSWTLVEEVEMGTGRSGANGTR